MIRHREGLSHLALTAVTLILVLVGTVPVNRRMTQDETDRRPDAALAASHAQATP